MDDDARELTPEQSALIARKQEEMRRQYDEYVAKQAVSKVEDILKACEGITKEQAELALGLCENDELDAIERFVNEPQFLVQIKRTLEGGPDLSATLDDENRSQYVPRARAKRHPERAEGYNVDGSRRAPTIHLNEALERLEEIKSKKTGSPPKKRKSAPVVPASPVRPAGSPAGSTRAAAAAAATAAAAASAIPAVAPEADTEAETEMDTLPTADAAESSPKSSKKKKGADDYTWDDLKQLEWSDARIKVWCALGAEE